MAPLQPHFVGLCLPWGAEWARKLRGRVGFPDEDSVRSKARNSVLSKAREADPAKDDDESVLRSACEADPAIGKAVLSMGIAAQVPVLAGLGNSRAAMPRARSATICASGRGSTKLLGSSVMIAAGGKVTREGLRKRTCARVFRWLCLSHFL